MTDSIHINVETEALSAGLAEAGAEIERVAAEQIIPAAALIDAAFVTAGRSIQSNLARAAESGTVSVKKLTDALLKDLRGFAVDALVRAPVQGLVGGILGGSFGGARGAGGFAAGGQSFLVGERGPELFTPAASGRVNPLGTAPVTVNMSLPGVADAESFRRSETQIAAALARAVGRGRRNL